ncbi:MAG: hypothetical protein AABX34_02395 [Nanoarchaeota archaeon]
MDIDEFLDKELKEQIDTEVNDKFGDKLSPAQASEPAPELPEKEEVKYEGSINQFFGLWGKISELKLKWDPKLYDELRDIAEKAKQELYKALANMERQKKDIKHLIGRALDEIDKKNYDGAKKLYDEISSMSDKLPDFLMDQKKELGKEMLALSQKLHEGMDRKFTSDFWGSALKIENFSKDAFLSFDAADLEKAKVLYEKALEEYKGLPKGFTQKKLELGERLLKLYKELSIQMQINELQRQLSISGISYKGIDGYERLKRLSDTIVVAKNPILNPENFKLNTSVNATLSSDRPLLNRLILRKLDRARVNLKKELYMEAKRNLEAVLRVDPENKEAKKLLGSVPIKV